MKCISILSDFLIDCPLSCKNCTTGGASDGGRAVNAEGICEHFCSVYGHCGSGENYKNGHDCSNCKQGISFYPSQKYYYQFNSKLDFIFSYTIQLAPTISYRHVNYS